MNVYDVWLRKLNDSIITFDDNNNMNMFYKIFKD